MSPKNAGTSRRYLAYCVSRCWYHLNFTSMCLWKMEKCFFGVTEMWTSMLSYSDVAKTLIQCIDHSFFNAPLTYCGLNLHEEMFGKWRLRQGSEVFRQVNEVVSSARWNVKRQYDDLVCDTVRIMYCVFTDDLLPMKRTVSLDNVQCHLTQIPHRWFIYFTKIYSSCNITARNSLTALCSFDKCRWNFDMFLDSHV